MTYSNAYLTQGPNSLTNPSGKYRVIRYNEFVEVKNGDRDASNLPSYGEFDSYEEAQKAATRMNDAAYEEGKLQP